ncbi:MAG: response regulator [Opitutaceae bacterium]
MKVLVVEDTASNRKLLRAILEAEGITVGEVADGVAALSALESEKFDAVISDILMPRMDGYRLCREIRRNPQLRHLPVIAYTSTYLSPGDEQLALRSGADRYLRKPVSVEVLLQTLGDLLQPDAPNRPTSLPPEDPLVMHEYNAVLVRKLEAKSLELEERNEELRLANEQLRALTARNETIRENERMTIAREIHDVLAQDLTSLKIDLVWVASRSTKPIDEAVRDAISTRLRDAVAQTDAAITTVQRIATELRPVILDSLGLPAAVEWQVEDFARRTGLAFRTRAPQGDSMLSRECATAVFRILQESLTNIARHAGATEIDVQWEEDPDIATLAVADNGRGITARQIDDARSIGLVGMRERAQAFGGSVEITGAPGAGTTVRVRIPLDHENATEPP